MNKKLAIGIAVIMAGMVLTSVSVNTAFAQADPGDPQRNNFGQGAEYIARGGDNDVTGLMGDHSSSFAGQSRTGIGNFGHPADVADLLCAGGGELCP
jgi:hypothetical protein